MKLTVPTWLTLPDPIAARLMARVGFDWLTVELEHAPTSFETAATSFAIMPECAVPSAVMASISPWPSAGIVRPSASKTPGVVPATIRRSARRDAARCAANVSALILSRAPSAVRIVTSSPLYSAPSNPMPQQAALAPGSEPRTTSPSMTIFAL